MDLTQTYLNRILRYCPTSGKLFWREKTGRKVLIGTEAGTAISHGYKVIRLQYKTYRAHRIIWFMLYGYFPPEIDHINGDRSDNRLSNLRAVTRKINAKNTRRRADNTSGCSGVTLRKDRGTWQAYIKACGKRITLGTFHDWFNAVCCRKAAENRYGYHPNHGR